MLKTTKLLILMVCAICFINNTVEAANLYEYKKLADVISHNFHYSKMNNVGQVCGGMRSGSNTTAAFWDSKIGIRLLHSIDGWSSYAVDINDYGYVTGYLHNVKTKKFVAFIWNPSNEEFKLGPDQIPRKINNSNEVIGNYGNGSFKWDGHNLTFSYKAYYCINDYGQIIDSEFIASLKKNIANHNCSINAIAINNTNQIIGTIEASHPMAFEYSNDIFHLLTHNQSPGATRAISINNNGQIVGAFTDPEILKTIGLLWENNEVFEINALIKNNQNNQINITWPIQINDKSEIVTQGVIDGKTEILILYPIENL